MFSFILPKERSDKLSFRNCSSQMRHVISVRQNESLETRAKSYKNEVTNICIYRKFITLNIPRYRTNGGGEKR